MDRPPNSKVNLDRAIQRLYGTGARFVEYRSIIANTIVGQFLPDGVAKGGSALKLRYGCLATRMTTDFDTAYQPWPTLIEKGENWDELYAAARGELPVRVTVDDAVKWANELISRIDGAR